METNNKFVPGDKVRIKSGKQSVDGMIEEGPDTDGLYWVWARNGSYYKISGENLKNLKSDQEGS